jgi:hypothetical protein
MLAGLDEPDAGLNPPDEVEGDEDDEQVAKHVGKSLVGTRG